jgi:hypothetical protein
MTKRWRLAEVWRSLRRYARLHVWRAGTRPLRRWHSTATGTLRAGSAAYFDPRQEQAQHHGAGLIGCSSQFC